MRLSSLAMAALLCACGTAAAEGTNVRIECEMQSDYAFSLTKKSVVLTRKTGEPKLVLMRQGRLFIDDAWVPVSETDRERLIAYEREARATMPLTQRIGREAADIAFIALSEVAKDFSGEPEHIERKLAEARKQLDRRLADSISTTHFNGDEFGRHIGDAVSETVPMVVGDIVGGALHAAFTGDAERLGRLDGLDERIDAIVGSRAKALERDADTLCERMRALDALDDALEYRHAGKPLDLLRTQPKRKETVAL
jgi:hypothetical protein